MVWFFPAVSVECLLLMSQRNAETWCEFDKQMTEGMFVEYRLFVSILFLVETTSAKLGV